MHRNPTPHTWMHQNHHPSSKCTGILPLTHECTKILTPQVNAPESYPSPMNAPKSWSMKLKHRNHTPHTWTQQNRHSSGKCTGILPLTHECTEIIIPQVTHLNPTPHTWMHRNHHPSSKCSGIFPLTHECTANRQSFDKCNNILPLKNECTDIVIPQINAPESYPSHMNTPKSSLLR